MIATVTLNPAVDKTIRASRVVMGAVNRMDEVTNMTGGKGINVARVLKQYKYSAKALGFLGGYNGQLILDGVRGMGVNPEFTLVSGETRTSINLITDDGYITELLEPGPEITREEMELFVTSYRQSIRGCDIVVISGSAPKGISPQLYVDMIEIAKKLDKKVLVDTSGENLKAAVKAKPFFIKPNLRELESLVGKAVFGIEEIKEAAKSLVNEGIPHVMVSMGAKGILYVYAEDGKIKDLYLHAPKISVINSVGCGDSAVAAFAMSTMQSLTPEETIKKCVSISAASAMSLENGLIDMDRAEEIYDALEF